MPDKKALSKLKIHNNLRKFCIVPLMAAALAILHPALGKDNGDPAKGGKADQQKAQATPVTVTPVILQSIPRQIRALGTVIPFQAVALTARINSQIVAVKFNAGDAVKAGQILFLLNDRTLKAQLAQAQAAVQDDRAQIENLQRQYDRARQGVEKGFFSQADADNARAALDAKKAAVAADAAAVQDFQAQLSYTVIASPIDGRTGTINFTLGNTVPANGATPLVTINQVEPISVQVPLPQDSYDAIRAAQRADGAKQGASGVSVTATRAGTGKVAKGVLNYIDNTIDSATGTFTARASFPNPDDMLWPGMLANITIDLDAGTPALVIPAVAVQHDQSGNDFVFVAAGGTAEKRPVKVERQQDDKAIIADGVKENDSVVTDGMMALKDGAAVSVTQTKGKPGSAADAPASSGAPP